MTLPVLFLISISFLVVIFLAWFFTRRAKFQEKVILLEKGIDIKDLKLIGNNSDSFPWLRAGIVFIGIALGLILIVLLENLIGIGAGLGVAIILLSAGLSMILANFIGRSKDNSR